MDGTEDEVRKAALQAAANVPSKIRRRRTTRSPELKPLSAVPQYLRDNEFILNHYRSDFSVRDGLASLFRIHNETGNVWTHLIGFFLFVGLTIYIVYAAPAHAHFGQEQLGAIKIGMVESLHVVKDGLHTLQDNLHNHLHNLQSNVQHNLLSLQESLHTRVHDLHENVHHRVSAWQDGVHTIQDNIQHLQDNIHQTASTLTHNLQGNLQQNLHSLQAHLQDVRVLLSAHLQKLLQPIKRWPVYVYMIGAMVCLLLSSICHLFGCCAGHYAKLMWRMDYSGIAVLIVASFVPPVYYGFMCSPFWRSFYLLITAAAGVGAVAVSLLPLFQTPKYRPIRAAMFAGLGAWGVVPLLHAWCLNSSVTSFKHAMMWDMLMGVTYLGGAAIYACRIPERWRPGAFDVVLHSHQIFHVAVVVAAVVHFRAVMILLKWREGGGACEHTSHPSASVAHDLQTLFKDFVAVEQVWDAFKGQLHLHLGHVGDTA